MSAKLLASGSTALALALESTPHVVFAASADGRVIFANAAARAHWGDAVQDGAPAAGLFADEARERLAAVAARVLTGGETGAFDASELGRSGVRTWARPSARRPSTSRPVCAAPSTPA